MAIQQDSSEETGIKSDVRSGEVQRAKDRKANAALQLRIAGCSWDEIAQAIGYPTPRAALVATERALERELQSEPNQKAMRKMHSDRLHQLLKGVWAKAIDANNPEHLVALDRAVKIIDRDIKLLGLDAPTQVVVSSPAESELERWVATVSRSDIPALEEADIFDLDPEDVTEHVEVEVHTVNEAGE